MEKVTVTQEEIDNGNGGFDKYMNYVVARMLQRSINPVCAEFEAINIICKDGHKVEFGSYKDAAGENISNWVIKFFGDRMNISYGLQRIAYEINRIVYLLFIPILPVEKILLTQAVEGLTEEMARSLSDKKIQIMEEKYNTLNVNIRKINIFEATTISHLETATQKLYSGAAHYALAKWESLQFVEKAMKEVLSKLDRHQKGADGHDIKGVLHDTWKGCGLPPLPGDLLENVMCSPAMRYEKTLQPLASTLGAYDSAIKLGSIISEQLSNNLSMAETMSVPLKNFVNSSDSTINRLIMALQARYGEWTNIKIIRN